VCKSKRQAFEGFFDQQAIAAGNNYDFSAAGDDCFGNPADERLPAKVGKKFVVLSEPLRGSSSQEHSCNIQACLVSRATLTISAIMETAISAGPSRQSAVRSALMRARSAR
jgi:hypothetical protein